MTEIPEHLLARSKARRAAMGGGGGDDAPAAATPATTDDAAPAPAAAAAPAAAPATPVEVTVEPTPPWVEAAETRKKIPVWAVPVLFLLPLWAVVYALTLDPPTDAESPLTVGTEVYGTNCATCHGATGGGSGNIPALVGETAVTKEFPRPADQVAWVALGSEGWLATGQNELPGGYSVKGGMPPWAASLTPDEIMAVVLHERHDLDEEEFDIAQWEDGFEETLQEYVPDDAAAYMAVLEEWKTTPPA